MSHRPGGGSTPRFKFASLKVYASTEWMADGRKKYRTVFDRAETTYIYAELALYNKLFDQEEWEVRVTLRVYAVSSKSGKKREVGVIDVLKKVLPDTHTLYVREGWGNDRPGEFWNEGEYVWEAYVDGGYVGEQRFFIYDVGEVSADENPYFDVEGLRFFEGPNAVGTDDAREYYVTFKTAETRFVWGELIIKNNLARDWQCELVYRFFNEGRSLKGQTAELVPIAGGESTVSLSSGWGADEAGTWFPGRYSLEISFMEILVAAASFEMASDFEPGTPTNLVQAEGSPYFQGIAERSQQLDNRPLEEVLAELDALIGLGPVKKRVREYATYLSFLKLRKEKGFKEDTGLSLNVVFKGNPGTGKTTVARMLGKIYHKLGLLSKGHVHEVDRADIIGEYIGQTAPKVKAAIEKARGGILFIDEAYALARSNEDAKDYGREVIEMLVKEMSSEKGDLAIIAAGYPKEMETFLNSNPGLKSRFNMHFDFPDYLPDELLQISEYAAEQQGVELAPDARGYLTQKFMDAYRKRDRTFGNARFAHSVVSESKMHLGLRVMRNPDHAALTREDLAQIKLDDVQEVFEPQQRLKARLPIDEDLLQRALNDLNDLIGLRAVKREVSELVELVRFYKEIGREVLHRFSLHMVFTGNPGTGKTTVARILGQIYKALGILERGDVVECDRQSLVAGFVGQTAIKTAEVIESARGCVMFLDEAYTLTQSNHAAGDFGKEAVETILKRMEDLRGELIVIVAGYPDNMKQFLEVNPGLKSRFDRKLEFEDYAEAELLDIAAAMYKREAIMPTPEALARLRGYFSHLYRVRNKFFGNARAVRKVVEKSIKNQHLRLAAIPRDARTKEMLLELIVADVAEFTPENDTLLEGRTDGRIGF